MWCRNDVWGLGFVNVVGRQICMDWDEPDGHPAAWSGTDGPCIERLLAGRPKNAGHTPHRTSFSTRKLRNHDVILHFRASKAPGLHSGADVVIDPEARGAGFPGSRAASRPRFPTTRGCQHSMPTTCCLCGSNAACRREAHARVHCSSPCEGPGREVSEPHFLPGWWVERRGRSCTCDANFSWGPPPGVATRHTLPSGQLALFLHACPPFPAGLGFALQVLPRHSLPTPFTLSFSESCLITPTPAEHDTRCMAPKHTVQSQALQLNKPLPCLGKARGVIFQEVGAGQGCHAPSRGSARVPSHRACQCLIPS